ncbi:hypothetical protein BLL42_27385 (plasmid) [Pseudomonas frederiksbergensis]|uniref:Lipoprotein n=1 Tax=Pseudomonas frederiksbergensis TaxID=104087 RepID=A0A1J0ETH4_9PSED|nr:hypothetical protein BLL42_27385 [Pseudomonas frederiksbergensis]
MNLKILLAIPIGFSIAGCTQPTPNVPQRDGAFLRFDKIGTGAVVLEAVVVSGQGQRVAAGDISKSGGKLKRWSDTYVTMGKCGRVRFVFDRADDKGRFWKASPAPESHQPGQGCQIMDWQNYQWQELAG